MGKRNNFYSGTIGDVVPRRINYSENKETLERSPIGLEQAKAWIAGCRSTWIGEVSYFLVKNRIVNASPFNAILDFIEEKEGRLLTRKELGDFVDSLRDVGELPRKRWYHKLCGMI